MTTPTDEELWASLGFHESVEASLECVRAPEFKMHACKGANLIGVGWENGTLRCAFASKTGLRYYRYFDVPEAEFEKLRKSPYPDRLFTTNIKNKFKGERDR